MPHTHKVAGSNPAGNKHIFRHLPVFLLLLMLMTHIEEVGSYGVMVSTLDFESSDPSSNLGRTSLFFLQEKLNTLITKPIVVIELHIIRVQNCPRLTSTIPSIMTPADADMMQHVKIKL